MIVLIRGGGDLASGVALRLYRAGLRVVITELPEPLAVRRLVSFAEAIYRGEITIEAVTARRVTDATDKLRILQILAKGQIPVLIDPNATSVSDLHPTVVVDARMTKQRAELLATQVKLIIGLGPGFEAEVNCHGVVETQRGPFMGRVYWKGMAETDTGLPEPVSSYQSQRILRAPASGELVAHAQIGDHLELGAPVAEVAGQVVSAPFAGSLRGLIHPGISVVQGLKIGDLDPRDDPRLATLISDKSLAVGGGVLEAIFSRTELRSQMWT